jgi:predicted DCC family thiol-disulfide oxidoreductase YuxK
MNYEVEVFYDGDCPLCMKEIKMLQRLDRAQRILFTDIASPKFDPSSLNKSFEDLMARIHGRLSDGTMIEGVEVFRRLYAAVGFRRMAAFSRWPGISHLLQLAYHLFAKNRLRLTGRCADDCKIPQHNRKRAA